MLSGFAGVYFEKVLKHRTPQISIWARNIQLSIATILLGSFYFAVIPPVYGLGKEFDWLIIGVMLNGAFMGILVALVVLYSDTIVKNFGTSVSVVVTSVVEYMFFSGKIFENFIFGALIVFLSIWIYHDSAAPPAAASNSNAKPTSKQHEASTAHDNDENENEKEHLIEIEMKSEKHN
jgi:UDP-sugar transporter A1/2/3